MPPFFSYFPALEKRNELSKFIRGSGNCPRGSSPAYAGLSGIWSLKKREAGFFCAYAQKKDLPFRYLYAILKIGNDPGRKTACVLIYPFGLPAFWREVFFVEKQSSCREKDMDYGIMKKERKETYTWKKNPPKKRKSGATLCSFLFSSSPLLSADIFLSRKFKKN